MSENKFLNSFTILSYNPDNVYVSFKSETLLLDEKEWIKEDGNESGNSSNNNETENQSNNEEFWIVDESGKNKISYGSIVNSETFDKGRIKAGPFFSIDLVVLYLNYFNELGL